MADKASELERIYTIPLRKAHHGTRSKRADRAIRDVRAFLTRHMKADNVWIGGDVNEAIWSRGKYRIPSRIRVRATRFDDGVVEVTMPEAAEGSAREAIQERQAKAAEAPVLAAGLMDEGEEEAGSDTSVTAIDGIGPATAEKLADKEIETVADLVAAGPAAVAAILGKGEDAVAPWFAQAEAMVETPSDSEE